MRVLAVDGGQSSLSVRFSPGPGRAAPALTLPGIGRWENHVDAVIDAVRLAVDRLGAPEIDTVVLGLSTAPRSADALQRLASGVADRSGADRVRIADDSVTTHAAAHRGDPGISLWVGTGVACLALGERGLRTFDGFGYLLGDLGGSFDIGRRALAAILRFREIYDAPAPPNLAPTADMGPLAAAARARFGSLDALPITVHDSPTPAVDIAAFAVDVIELADDRGGCPPDPVARDIIAAAVQDLSRTAALAAQWIGHPVPIVLGGGVMGAAAAPSPVARLLSDMVRSDDTAVTVAETSALDGASWLGRQPGPTPYDSHMHYWTRSPRR